MEQIVRKLSSHLQNELFRIEKTPREDVETSFRPTEGHHMSGLHGVHQENTRRPSSEHMKGTIRVVSGLLVDEEGHQYQAHGPPPPSVLEGVTAAAPLCPSYKNAAMPLTGTYTIRRTYMQLQLCEQTGKTFLVGFRSRSLVLCALRLLILFPVSE